MPRFYALVLLLAWATPGCKSQPSASSAKAAGTSTPASTTEAVAAPAAQMVAAVTECQGGDSGDAVAFTIFAASADAQSGYVVESLSGGKALFVNVGLDLSGGRTVATWDGQTQISRLEITGATGVATLREGPGDAPYETVNLVCKTGVSLK